MSAARRATDILLPTLLIEVQYRISNVQSYCSSTFFLTACKTENYLGILTMHNTTRLDWLVAHPMDVFCMEIKLNLFIKLSQFYLQHWNIYIRDTFYDVLIELQLFCNTTTLVPRCIFTNVLSFL